jgi:Domain of unknown function (DUF4252)
MRTLKAKIWPHIFLQAALVCGLSVPGWAQNARLELKNLEKLSNKAATVNDITLEGDMLRLGLKFIEMDEDPEAKQLKELLKDLKGIYVKNFEFDEPNQYSPADVEAIRAQLSSPGWSRIVESRNKRQDENDEIYVMKVGEKIAGVAILVAEPKELTVVNIVGPIDINKLGELEGHFGIPGDSGSHHRKKGKTDEAKPASGKPAPEKKGSDDDEN